MDNSYRPERYNSHTSGMESDIRSVGWRSPSNIALIKYWGKRKGQIPGNPSISITLSKSFTETVMRYSPARPGKGRLKNFIFEGSQQKAFADRLRSYLKSVTALYPFLPDYDLSIESRNSFPHSSGIASSASAMAAVALCLTSMEQQLFGSPSVVDSFFIKASYAARLGSGSAARSVYPGYVLWGRYTRIPHSADEFAIPLNDLVHKDLREMKDSILIVDEKPKAVSSSQGHSLMHSSPWAPVRYLQAADHTRRMIRVLSSGDIEEFVRIVESEALTLHSLMMNSGQGYILMKPGTLEIIQKVRDFRNDTGIPVAFSLDAGPNVHLIYPGDFADIVRKFVEQELLGSCSRGQWIDDHAGRGPVIIQSADR